MFHLFLAILGDGRHRVEAAGQLLQERAEPELVEDQEPGFRWDVETSGNPT
jgi:hypothetical protein